MAAVSWCKGALRAVLVLNTMLYATVLGLAASSINKILDNDVHHRLTGNISTVHFLIFSLISGVMGLCSIAAGLVHLGAWRGDSLAAAVSSALVAWSMTVVTFGFACKLMCFGNHWGANMVKAYADSQLLRASPMRISIFRDTHYTKFYKYEELG